MNRFSTLALITLALCVYITSCVPSNAEPITDKDSKHIIVLGFDGWGASSFDQADMPFIKSILTKSAWTLHKRSILPTSSACNWATMFKGAGPEAHGYIDWDTKAPAFEVTEKNSKGLFPSVFSLFRDYYPKSEMGYFYQWDGMGFIFDMDDFSYTASFPVSAAGSNQMKNAASSYIINEKPNLAIFIWDYPDKTGHTSGWYKKEYMTELTRIDSFIESIVNACKEAGIIDNTIFVITSDHGGHDKTHHQPIMSDLETPFIIFGPGINPGEIVEPLMQYDVASILADCLRLKHPSSWRGKTPEGIFK